MDLQVALIYSHAKDQNEQIIQYYIFPSCYSKIFDTNNKVIPIAKVTLTNTQGGSLRGWTDVIFIEIQKPL